jgi:hypothetical protein
MASELDIMLLSALARYSAKACGPPICTTIRRDFLRSTAARRHWLYCLFCLTVWHVPVLIGCTPARGRRTSPDTFREDAFLQSPSYLTWLSPRTGRSILHGDTLFWRWCILGLYHVPLSYFILFAAPSASSRAIDIAPAVAIRSCIF